MDKITVLNNYLPPGAAPVIARWIDYFECEFKISRNRSTKHGDYRHPFKNAGHRISVNYDLNSYAFLITTVHEFAHLLTWNEYKRKAKPHGQEWKNNFKRMMKPFFEQSIFPPDINHAIQNYLENPAASSCVDLKLYRVLKQYDSKPAHIVCVEKLPMKTLFSLPDGRVFRKEALVRKRYRCVEIKTGAVYLFNALSEVTVFEQKALS